MFLSVVMEMFKIRLWWCLFNYVSILKTIELYTLNGWILWYVNISPNRDNMLKDSSNNLKVAVELSKLKERKKQTNKWRKEGRKKERKKKEGRKRKEKSCHLNNICWYSDSYNFKCIRKVLNRDLGFILLCRINLFIRKFFWRIYYVPGLLLYTGEQSWISQLCEGRDLSWYR